MCTVSCSFFDLQFSTATKNSMIEFVYASINNITHRPSVVISNPINCCDRIPFLLGFFDVWTSRNSTRVDPFPFSQQTFGTPSLNVFRSISLVAVVLLEVTLDDDDEETEEEQSAKQPEAQATK